MWRVETHDSVDSTHDLLQQRVAAGEDCHGLVIRAATQTAGRGQRRRDWLSGRGGSWQSAALRTTPPPGVTLRIGIGIVRALAVPGMQLKWPNDLMLDGRKAGGILTGSSRGHLLTGVGINVGNEVPAGAGRVGLPLETVNQAVLDGIIAGLALERLSDSFAACDWLLGRRISVAQGGREVKGEAAGIDADGRLVVRTLSGPVLVESGVPYLLAADRIE